MSKYIIEIDDDLTFDVQFLQAIGAEPNGVVRIRHIEFEDLEELNSDYINEHFGDLQDTAYQRGLEEGKKAFDLLDTERDAEYQRGLNDAWEAARKIVKMPDPPYWGVFDEYKDDLFRKITAGEAIEKLKVYEEKQKADDEIKVGDEVIYNNTIKCLVVRPETDERYAVLIDGNGHHHSADHRECKKTGRHFDISSILKEMQS